MKAKSATVKEGGRCDYSTGKDREHMIKSVKEYDASQNKPNAPTMSDFATSKGILAQNISSLCLFKQKQTSYSGL